MILQCMILLFLVSYGSSSVDPPDCIMKESELITNNNSVHLIPSITTDPCEGIRAGGESLADMISILHNHLCGCVYITTDIEITPNNNWNDIYIRLWWRVISHSSVISKIFVAISFCRTFLNRKIVISKLDNNQRRIFTLKFTSTYYNQC